jgi:hypothetical protein
MLYFVEHTINLGTLKEYFLFFKGKLDCTNSKIITVLRLTHRNFMLKKVISFEVYEEGNLFFDIYFKIFGVGFPSLHYQDYHMHKAL